MVGQSPVVRWQWVAYRTPIAPREANTVGVTLGTLVGLAFVLAPSALGVFRGTLEFSMPSAGADLLVPAAVVLAGALGGAIIGPSAWRAQTFVDWARAVCALAAIAVPIGALVIGEAAAIAGAGVSESPGVSTLLAPLTGLVLAALGTATFGIFVLPFTLAASVIWAIGMRLAVPSIKSRS